VGRRFPAFFLELGGRVSGGYGQGYAHVDQGKLGAVDLATAPLDNGILPLVLDKINVIRDRRYVARGEIELLMNYFAVSKGDTDVRVVYDSTLSGLNASLWAPYFPLPTLQSHLRIVKPGTYMADNDVGECFHN
jgi:hypothetical protein